MDNQCLEISDEFQDIIRSDKSEQEKQMELNFKLFNYFDQRRVKNKNTLI